MEKIFAGIDFHKNKCVIYTTDQQGKMCDGHPRISTIFTKNLISYYANKEKCTIAIEATGGVNPFVSKLKEQGHQVHIINPNKFRGIGISGKKTDERDAKALNTFIRLNPDSDCEVHLRSEGSRKIKSLIVARELAVRSRINTTNHIRGTLREFALPLPQGVSAFWEKAPAAIEKLEDPFIKLTLKELYNQAMQMKQQENQIHERLEFLAQNNETVKRLQTIPGVGLLTALAMIAVIDDVGRFPNADQFSSYLGLTPRVSASADKRMMGAITRSGSEILRRYLVHGARAWLKANAKNGQIDPVKKWALHVESKRGTNKATVALARKMSRIAFAILRDGTTYKEHSLENEVQKLA